MSDWTRASAILGTAFVAVMVVTLGLAAVLVPGQPPAALSGGDDPTGAPGDAPVRTRVPEVIGRPGIGGALVVTGDLEGTFVLERETFELRYALTGPDGRIAFEGEPATVAHLLYQGWEFFPDADACAFAPHDPEATGIGQADLVCTDLEEIRDKGTISVEGSIGLPAEMLVDRTLPETGGTLEVGHEAWTFEELTLSTWELPVLAGSSRYHLELVDRTTAMDEGVEDPSRLNLEYDLETREIVPVTVERAGEQAEVPQGACEVGRRELGQHNPRTTVIELTISCAEVDVPGLGTVRISGSVVVDELGWPE